MRLVLALAAVLVATLAVAQPAPTPVEPTFALTLKLSTLQQLWKALDEAPLSRKDRDELQGELNRQVQAAQRAASPSPPAAGEQEPK